MRMKTISTCVVGMLLTWSQFPLNAQTVEAIRPRTCLPGQATKLVIQGKDLTDSLRVATNVPGVTCQLEKVEPTQAVVLVTIPAEFPLGPVPLWLVTHGNATQTRTLLVDDLPVVADNGANHSMETAQEIPTLASVEGVCDTSASDFYRIHVAAGQRVACEVHTQVLHSAMDPVCRVLNADGKTLIQADDTNVGPDNRFSYQFPEEGDYWIEVHDNRNAAGGALYQLRVGDFPVVSQSYPLAVQTDQKTRVAFLGADADLTLPSEVQLAAGLSDKTHLRARLPEGQSSTWVPLQISKHPQIAESAATETLAVPVGISGCLQQTKEVDKFVLQGVKGQTVRFTSRTRSLNSPTLLQMQLFTAAGAKVTETKVADSDEWSMDATFPEDGEYRLEVCDLLKRGGVDFGYWVEIAPAGTFAVSLQGDANTREHFGVAPKKGACAIDLTVARFGFNGEIDLSLANAGQGLRILNPRIPAGAGAARIYLTADDQWKPGQFEVLKIVATAVGNPQNACVVDSYAIRRAKEPVVLAPNPQLDGAIAMAAIAESESPFALEPATPIAMARPVRSHAASLTLKRVQAEFKAGVEILSTSLPSGWGLTAKPDKDTYNLTLTRAEGEPEQLSMLVYGEFNGAGRLETFDVPVRWFDPVQVKLDFPHPLIRGGKGTVQVNLSREGGEPQPVTLTFANLPTGITAPESLVVAADQTSATFELTIANEAALNSASPMTINAASKFGGQDFTVASTHELPPLIASPSELVIYPSAIQLHDPLGRQQLVLQSAGSEETSRDWTRLARFTSTRPEVAEVRDGVVYPVADGEAEVVVELGAIRQTIPVQVTHMTTTRPVEFESEVLVALSKQGCNSGACHGSPSGKGGFRLSLRAFDMKLDELTLIREEFGRRINTLEPEESLLLLKPMMKVAHGGGKLLHKQDEAFAILRDWIAGGAKADPAGSPRITKLEVFPSEKQVHALADGAQQFAVTAHFSDGRTRDVTHLAAYETSNTSVATVDAHGLVTPRERGEVVVLVRVLEYIESVSLMFVEDQEGFQWAAPPANNYIDELVNAKLQQLQYVPAQTCSDAEFIRRVYLDLLGILPTVEESTSFLADTSEDKRTRLIDALLEREEYSKFWALKWGDLLKMTSKQVGDEGVYKYHRWVENALDNNMPYDQFAMQLLTGSGSTLANPPANFYRTSADMNDSVETISQVFLGARLQCAKCHNHPFERWTQDNYYGLGAFFNRVQKKKTGRPGELFIYAAAAGEVTQPRTGQVMSPWLPQVGSIERSPDTDQRVAFAEWLVKPDNPYFARIEANRIWSQLFARGIVDPIDDFRDSNPPTNGPLLDALAQEFVDSGYDRKQLLRSILSSRTYQASHVTGKLNRDDTLYFSHQEPRMLSAEQLLDAINQTLNLEQKFGGLPEGTKATQLPAPDVVKVDFLKVFGQPERSTVCACERADDSNLGMAIELFNGPLIHEKLRSENNRFRKSLAEGKSVEEVIREIYLAAVCRPPADIELKTALEHCAKSPDPAAGVEDVCWALFNTDEFLFQH
ncbi:DUF1549 domain-containing protein [Bremerella cremea]|uniref:DUF1549 domain-containing protein n=1 Tax=Bremerella cremea TaxID=1031537 RepID=A0A368KSB9_9BACT|nr:DUF1549 domain-containing protein [Bremerella cremea]RCS47614.1 DUF1549 domain-containing protein [Bremerella cremea]